MSTKNSTAILLLAAVTAISSNTTAMGQQVGRAGSPFSKVSVKRGTLRKVTTRRRFPGKIVIPKGGIPSINERPKRTEAEIKFAEASRLMSRYKQWMIGANATGFVYPNLSSGSSNKKYNLKGSVIKKFLHYEKQGTFGGINLGWTDNASASTASKRAQWFFQRPGGPSAQLQPLVYGEPIALAWGSGGKPFLKYSKRNVGINLSWSAPSFEWTILGRTPGEKVRRGQDWVILYNLKHKLPMMYFDRSKGAHIGWPDSKRWAQSIIKNPRYLAALADAAETMMKK